MPRDAHNTNGVSDDGVLGHVSSWLHRLSQQPQTRIGGPIDQHRFYHEVAEWVGHVQQEMDGLCAAFQETPDAAVAAENIAAAMSRIRLKTGALALPQTPILKAHAAPQPLATNVQDRTETTDADLSEHQRGVREIRQSVATLREKLAAERAERAQAAADERRRYVDTLRESIRSTRAQSSASTPTSAPAPTPPQTPARGEQPTPPEPMASTEDAPPEPALPDQAEAVIEEPHVAPEADLDAADDTHPPPADTADFTPRFRRADDLDRGTFTDETTDSDADAPRFRRVD